MTFKKYRRKNTAEIRDLRFGEGLDDLLEMGVSVSEPDSNLSFEEFIKGKVARNPDNHEDQWYIASDYFYKNFEEVTE